MSAFAFNVKKTVPLAIDGETATIKKLGWKALEAAREVTTAKGLEMVKAIGWSELQKTVTQQGGEDAIKAQTAADPFLQHDALTLIEKGLVSWSLSDKVTADEIAALDEPVARALAREVYELSRPRTEDEQKNA